MSWRRFAKAYRPRERKGQLNQLEKAYLQHLDLRQKAGEIRRYWVKGIKLSLAPNTTITVDFFVLANDDVLEAHETKGFMEDDAAVKLKVAAKEWPFRFFLVKKRLKRDGGGFSITEIPGE